MSCKEVLQQLSNIVDKEAPMMTRLSFYLHISMCRNCRKYFEQFKQVKETAELLEEEDFSEAFFDVMERALAQVPERKETSSHEELEGLPGTSD